MGNNSSSVVSEQSSVNNFGSYTNHKELKNTEFRDFQDIQWDPNFSKDNIQKEEVEGVASLTLLRNFITPNEADRFIELFEKLGWSSSDPNKTHHIITSLTEGVRKCFSERIYPFLPKEIVVDNKTWTLIDDSNCEHENIRGKYSISEKTRLNRYPYNIEFLKHYDDCDRVSDNIRSILSFVLYLNDDFEGGETIFYPHNGDPVKIRPERGMVTIFLHTGTQNPPHSSSRHTSPGKYKVILRTNILYSNHDDDHRNNVEK